MKKLQILLACTALLLTAGCTHNKVTTSKVSDVKMNCAQIDKEIQQVESIKQDIENKRGLSGRNVGMALLFWPGVLVNEMNGSEAAKLANQRAEKLNDLYIKKGCS